MRNEEVFEAVAEAMQRGEPAALVTIIRAQGSTPQRVGAKMLVFPDGRTVGTIGGGCYENEAFWKARTAIETRQPVIAKYELADDIAEDPAEWKTVTEREPGAAERQDLAFAWKAAKHIKSNAIVFVKDRALVGMGAGQPNRVVSVHLSQRIAGDKAKGAVLASDAFFPFPDNIELAAEAGVTAIVQPGGSVRDEEVIAAADQAGLAMVFTGVRHFRH